MTPNQDHPRYFLGHATEELDRLERQGAFLATPTRSLFYRAGVRPGMDVLDFGCGVGDTSLLAAELVGPTGSVVGFDRSADAVEVARARAAAKGLTNLRFEQADEHAIAAVLGDRRFDALVGRLVMIHQADPRATLRRLLGHVRPGGVVAFHEIDLECGHWTSHPNPLLAQLWRWIDGMAARGVMPTALGRRLLGSFHEIGLTDGLIIREGRLVRADDHAANAWIAGFARSIVQPVQRLGLASDADKPVDVLLEELRGHPSSAEALNIPVYMVGATAVVPAIAG